MRYGLYKSALLLLLLISGIAPAQNFKWNAALDSIQSEGFYKVQLPPSITSKLRTDLNDIRILDSKKQEVPYIAKAEQPVTYTTLFKEYKIVKLERAKKQTTLILQNPKRAKIDNVHLVIKNADVYKTLRLTGSNDQKEWFVIKDRQDIYDVYSNVSASVIRIFDFPISDYEFLRIDIQDSTSPPLNIIKAGYYDTYAENIKYAEAAQPVINHSDSSNTKTSWIKVTFPEPQLIDKIDLNISGEKFYMRDCELVTEQKVTLRNNKVQTYYNTLTEFTISSNGMNSLVHNFRTKEFYIKIYNRDNPPLKVNSVKCSQINHSLVAWFKKGEIYSLAFGNEKIKVPEYDLVNFRDSVTSFTAIAPGNITAVEAQKVEEKKAETTWFSSNTFIWISLGLVMIVLGIMSVKMIRETRQ